MWALRHNDSYNGISLSFSPLFPFSFLSALPFMPPNILITVFNYLLPVALWDPPPPPLDILAASLVCHEWQTTAEPFLQHLFVDPLSSYSYDLGHLERFVRLLQTSRDLRLHHGDHIDFITIDLQQLRRFASIQRPPKSILKRSPSSLESRDTKTADLLVDLFAISRNLQAIRIHEPAHWEPPITDHVISFYFRIEPFCSTVTHLGFHTLYSTAPDTTHNHLDLLIRILSPTLHSISAQRLQLTPDVFDALAACPNMAHYEHYPGDPRIITVLPSWPNLESFSIMQSHLHPAPGLESVVVQLGISCRRLRSLTLDTLESESCTRQYDAPNLHTIQASNASLCFLAGRCRHIERVVIVRNQKIMDSFLCVLGRNATRLKYLELDACHGLTGKDIRPGDLRWPRLRQLRLRGCSGIRPSFIEAVLEACPMLREVWCPYGFGNPEFVISEWLWRLLRRRKFKCSEGGCAWRRRGRGRICADGVATEEGEGNPENAIEEEFSEDEGEKASENDYEDDSEYYSDNYGESYNEGKDPVASAWQWLEYTEDNYDAAVFEHHTRAPIMSVVEVPVDVDVDADENVDQDVDVEEGADVDMDENVKVDVDNGADMDIGADTDIGADMDVDEDVDVGADVDVDVNELSSGTLVDNNRKTWPDFLRGRIWCRNMAREPEVQRCHVRHEKFPWSTGGPVWGDVYWLSVWTLLLAAWYEAPVIVVAVCGYWLVLGYYDSWP
ncbi:hypothetical protein BC938DRAFT_484026 [Jimgerdemannia flammicorona]|uniref:F-box domain-containing protein n=1 Tax=Jimgerdemannia flammicorona TaxID=994334 RepID=A0A433QVE1_9FUNG|nr:hypothetical protein BC938DRAFT_484026 [Jimgerdemannia flammicorona]